MNNRRRISVQQTSYLQKKLCPLCENMVLARYYDSNSNRVLGLPNFQGTGNLSFAECPVCYGTWLIYEETTTDIFVMSEIARQLLSIEGSYIHQEEDLLKDLPTHTQNAIKSLVIILIRALKEFITTGKVERTDEISAPDSVLEIISGKEILVGNTQINFGNENQLGDVTIRDVVRGNIFHFTLNINS